MLIFGPVAERLRRGSLSAGQEPVGGLEITALLRALSKQVGALVTPTERGEANPCRYVNSSPKVSRLVATMYMKYPLALRNVEDLLFERVITSTGL